MAEAHDPNDPDNMYEVPPYLEALFIVWSLIGPAGSMMLQAHEHAGIVAHGFTDVDTAQEIPPDLVLKAWLDSSIEQAEAYMEHDTVLPMTKNDGSPVNNHDMLVITINALAILHTSLKGRLQDLDGLPDWLDK